MRSRMSLTVLGGCLSNYPYVSDSRPSQDPRLSYLGLPGNRRAEATSFQPIESRLRVAGGPSPAMTFSVRT
jgi:hypothetical protein